MSDIDEKFNKIKQAYQELEDELQRSGKGLVYRTEVGIYGTTSMDNIFKFFKDIQLQNYDHILDLGSGDGRVSLIASLFTKSTGIEYDEELTNIGIEIRDKLNLNCNLVADDFFNHDFTKYDIFFMNPDHEFGLLNDKLKTEMHGPLFIYNELFWPKGFLKGRKFWAGQIPIVSYLNKE